MNIWTSTYGSREIYGLSCAEICKDDVESSYVGENSRFVSVRRNQVEDFLKSRLNQRVGSYQMPCLVASERCRLEIRSNHACKSSMVMDKENGAHDGAQYQGIWSRMVNTISEIMEWSWLIEKGAGKIAWSE